MVNETEEGFIKAFEDTIYALEELDKVKVLLLIIILIKELHKMVLL